MTHPENVKARQERDAYRAELAGVRSFAGKIRKIIHDKGPVRACEIADWLDLVTKKERRRVNAAICDLLKAGHIRRVETGVYAPPEQTPPRQDKKNVMWRVLRAKRVVTAEDLEEVAEVSRAYALEWLRELSKKQVVRQLENGRFRLIADTVQPPDLTDNAEKLRALRARQKAALKAMNAAQTALNEARNLLAGE